MANPQAENGHTDIANELVEVLCKTRFSGREWQIIWTVFRKTWGWKKKVDAISKSQFSDMTGIPRQKCQEILKSLVERKILIKGVTQKGNTSMATYGFNKNYEDWKVLPKKVTVTQKGNGVLPKKVTEVLPKKVNTKEKKETRQNIRDLLPKKVTPELWNEFKKHRTRKKAPLTDYAEYLMAKKLTELESQGFNPVELINKTIEKGWQDIEPDWIYKNKQPNQSKGPTIKSAKQVFKETGL